MKSAFDYALFRCLGAAASRLMLTVVAGILRRDGRILICQRRTGSRHALKWEFPGGKVEANEAPGEALRRELCEELGIEVRAERERARYSYRYPSRPPIRLIFFEVEDFRGEPENRVFERMKWEEPHRLAGYDFLEADQILIRQLQD